MLLCSMCGGGWHTFCLNPPLSAVPEGEFRCPLCTGVREETVVREMQPDLGVGRDQARVATKRHLSHADQKEVDACEALHGRIKLLHALDANTGKPVTLVGKLTFLGAESLPKCLQVRYSNGTVEHTTSRAAKQGLQPSGYIPTVQVNTESTGNNIAAAGFVQGEADNAWPAQWELRESSDMQRVLRKLQPGKWPSSHCTRLLNGKPGTAAYTQFVRDSGTRVGHAGRLKLLTRVVNLAMASSLVDPWADGLPEGAGLWADMGLNVMRNGAKEVPGFELKGDALQPEWYQGVTSRKLMGTVVSMPWSRLLDLAMPMPVAFAKESVFMEVPVTWVTAAPPPRAKWLDGLREQGRLLCILGSMGKPVASMPVHWLCVFQNTAVRKSMVRAAYKDCGDVCFVH